MAEETRQATARTGDGVVLLHTALLRNPHWSTPTSLHSWCRSSDCALSLKNYELATQPTCMRFSHLLSASVHWLWSSDEEAGAPCCNSLWRNVFGHGNSTVLLHRGLVLLCAFS